MSCPSVEGDATQAVERGRRWAIACSTVTPAGRRTYNERTSTSVSHVQAPTDIALRVVLWRLWYKLSRDVAGRGWIGPHDT